MVGTKWLARVTGPVIYGGNHGLEIVGHGMDYHHQGIKPARHHIAVLSRKLKRKIAHNPALAGCWIEDKTFSLSIHFRQAAGSSETILGTLIRSAIADCKTRMKILKGKKVFDIIPALGWDKGRAVKHVLSRSSRFDTIFCFGDDTTDEYMFAAVGRRALSVSVGSRIGSKASYHVDSTKAVIQVLRSLNRVKT